jgi:excisionase family DNA binding protein
MLDHVRLLRVEDAALLLDCSKRHVFTLIATGRLRAIKLSTRATRIAAVELERFIGENARPSGEGK